MMTQCHQRVTGALLALSLAAGLCGLSGCGSGVSEAGQAAAGELHETIVRSADPGDDEAPPPLPPGILDRFQRKRQADAQPAEDDVPQAENPLIRGLQQLLDTSLGATDFTNERNDLGQSLIEADSLLTRVKQENRSAMRQAFRQVRVTGPASPNIVLIVAQQLGASDVGCYGGSDATPNIDRLAADGIRFTDFRPAGSRRLSRWSLMTGLEPGSTDDSRPLLHPEHFALGEVLWQAGYATGFIGLWGVPESARLQGPNAHGFDEWFGYFRESETETDYPDSLWSNSSQVKVLANANGKQGRSAHDFLTQESLSFLERRSRRPFFLTVVLSDPGTATIRSAAVAQLDDYVGAISEKLSTLGIDQYTSVWLASDAASAGFDNAAGAAAPLVVRWPTRIDRGRVSGRRAGFHDLLPTFADVAGAIQRPQQIDGASLLSTITAVPAADESTGE